MVFLMTLRRMELAVTAHGFRSSFRDWAAEETAFPNFVVEKALAHAIESKVEAAYRRGDLLKTPRADGRLGGPLRRRARQADGRARKSATEAEPRRRSSPC